MKSDISVTIHTPPVEPVVTITMPLTQARAVREVLGRNNSRHGPNTFNVLHALSEALRAEGALP